MSQRDIYSILSFTPVLGAIAPTTDQTSAAIALSPKYQAFLLGIQVGVGGITFDDSNKIEFKLTKSIDGGSNYVAAVQADVRGVTVGSGGIVRSLIVAHAAPSIVKVGLVRGDITHIKLMADFTGTHGAATPFAAWLAMGMPLIGPAA